DRAAAEMREDRVALIVRRHVTGGEPPGEDGAVAGGGEDTVAPRADAFANIGPAPEPVGERWALTQIRDAIQRAERVRIAARGPPERRPRLPFGLRHEPRQPPDPERCCVVVHRPEPLGVV